MFKGSIASEDLGQVVRALKSAAEPTRLRLLVLLSHGELTVGELCFLEVTSDIRERVRWRRQMIEIEKLTSMGKMAAGTAHHLNSPLAALLIRTELIRQHSTGPAFDA